MESLIGNCPDPDTAPGERVSDASHDRNELSLREVECLQLIASGLKDLAIASALNLSRHTVRFHIRNGCRKLGAANRYAAIYRASKLNVI